MGCSMCGGESLFVRGYCKPCYSAGRRVGTIARVNATNKGTCTAEGCSRRPFARGLCGLHYQRAQHPVMHLWKAMRGRNAGNYPAEWDDFDTFLAVVGERPSPKHQLRRKDAAKPWSAENWFWREPMEVGWVGGQNRAAYMKAWAYRDKFGLSEADLKGMYDAQDGRCAICRLELDRIDPETGKPIRTCVDHDHATGAVRGLLDDPCNKALGMFDDSVESLRAAITYLEHHQKRAAAA